LYLALEQTRTHEEAKELCKNVIKEKEESGKQNYHLLASNDSLRATKDELHTTIMELRAELSTAEREKNFAQGRLAELQESRDKEARNLRQVIRERDQAERDVVLWRDRAYQGWRPPRHQY
jgi:chromosome segregation ATPase